MCTHRCVYTYSIYRYILYQSVSIYHLFLWNHKIWVSYRLTLNASQLPALFRSLKAEFPPSFLMGDFEQTCLKGWRSIGFLRSLLFTWKAVGKMAFFLFCFYFVFWDAWRCAKCEHSWFPIFGYFLVNLERLHLTLPLPSRCTWCYWLVVSIWPKTGKNSCWKKPRTYLAGAHGGRCLQKHPAVGKCDLQGFFGAGWLYRKGRKFTYEWSLV